MQVSLNLGVNAPFSYKQYYCSSQFLYFAGILHHLISIRVVCHVLLIDIQIIRHLMLDSTNVLEDTFLIYVKNSHYTSVVKSTMCTLGTITLVLLRCKVQKSACPGEVRHKM